MTDKRPQFWFGLKRYGYGWGLPVRWQGWVVLAVYIALLLGGVHVFEERVSPRVLLVYFGVLTAILIGVVVAKGERPLRWRWGAK